MTPPFVTAQVVVVVDAQVPLVVTNDTPNVPPGITFHKLVAAAVVLLDVKVCPPVDEGRLPPPLGAFPIVDRAQSVPL